MVKPLQARAIASLIFFGCALTCDVLVLLCFVLVYCHLHQNREHRASPRCMGLLFNLPLSLAVCMVTLQVTTSVYWVPMPEGVWELILHWTPTALQLPFTSACICASHAYTR
jgi:hypothetical protein